MNNLVIRKLDSADYPVWSKLMAEYFAFYKFTPQDGQLEQLFHLITDSGKSLYSMYSLLASIDNKPLGIANYVYHVETFNLQLCYLNDLYVSQEARGLGVASQLLAKVSELSQQDGIKHMYLLTAPDNNAAAALYDKTMTKAKWVIYEK